MIKRKHINAIFPFSENASQLLTDATTFYTTVGTAPASTLVTVAPAFITAAQGRVATARSAESAVGTGLRGLAAARDLAVAAVVTDVRTIVSIVQNAANAALDVATATTIVTECGLVTRKTASKAKGAFVIKSDAITAGLLDFVYKAAARGVKVCYETQQSTDGVNWVTVKVTPDCSITYAHGMVTGTKLYFRGRVILSEKKGGAQAWLTPPIAFIYTL